MTTKTSLSTWIIGGVVLAALLKCTTDGMDRDSKAQEKRAAAEAAMTPGDKARAAESAKQAELGKAAAEARFQTAVMYARAIKASMKNPASFELVSAARMESGALCYEYRGTNSFNAVVPNFTVVPPNAKPVSGAAAWNKHCAGKSGDDLSAISYAM
jgi:hypothetical protein